MRYQKAQELRCGIDKDSGIACGVEMTEAQRTVNFLLHDCCRGRPEFCSPEFCSPEFCSPEFCSPEFCSPEFCSPASFPAIKGTSPASDRKYKVLLICTGNSARSIFAESILRKKARDRFKVFSAGTKPRSELNPFALEVLEQQGHDISVLRSKNLAEFQRSGAPEFDFVFTVCNQAANEECPVLTGHPVSAHWGMDDPVKADGTHVEKRLAFQKAYGALHNGIMAFTTLPITSFDHISLQKAMDDIGRTSAGASA
jgi:arsenate reductase